MQKKPKTGKVVLIIVGLVALTFFCYAVENVFPYCAETVGSVGGVILSFALAYAFTMGWLALSNDSGDSTGEFKDFVDSPMEKLKKNQGMKKG